MLRAIVVGRKQGEKDFTTLVQPTDPKSAGDAFKRLHDAPGDIVEMQLWQAHVIRRKTFAEQPAPVAAAAPQSLPPPASAPEPSPEEGDEDGPSLAPKSKKK